VGSAAIEPMVSSVVMKLRFSDPKTGPRRAWHRRAGGRSRLGVSTVYWQHRRSSMSLASDTFHRQNGTSSRKDPDAAAQGLVDPTHDWRCPGTRNRLPVCVPAVAYHPLPVTPCKRPFATPLSSGPAHVHINTNISTDPELCHSMPLCIPSL
jgi:hypothetical protein